MKNYFIRFDWFTITSVSVLLISSISIFTLCWFPVYPDEIQVRFWLSRLPYDYPKIISGLPTCISSFLQPLPETFYLPSLFNWVIHGILKDVFSLRITGILIAFSWLFGLIYYLSQQVKKTLADGHIQCFKSTKYLDCVVFVLVISLEGVLPVFLISNRSEQLILPSIFVLVLIFVFCLRPNLKLHIWNKTGLTVLYYLAVSLVLFGHPKGLFFSPFLLFVGVNLFRKFNSAWVFVCGISLFFFHIFQAYFTWTSVTQCKEMSQFASTLKSVSLDPASLFYDPSNFLNTAINSLLNFPKYLNQLSFQKITDISYLPAAPLEMSVSIANFFIKLNTSIVFLILLIFLPILFYKRELVDRRFFSVNFMLLVLFFCVLVSAIFNLPKNWYDAGYIYALLFTILIFFLGENFQEYFQKSLARKLIIYLAAVSLLSQAVFISRYLPPFLAGYAGPGVSLVTLNSTKLHHDLRAASGICKIDPISSKRIIVDDYTYLYFRKSRWPMAITYIGLHNDLRGILDFVSKINSDGLVVNCVSIPPSPHFLSVVKREGSICCIPKDDLKNLPKNTIVPLK